MAKVTYVRDDGERRTLDVPDGTSLMAAAVSRRLDGIVGECGGQMICATCHVYVASDALDGIVVHTPETQL
jgi:2Fe-2S ferredoxin